MRSERFSAAAPLVAAAVIGTMAMLSHAPRLQAQDSDESLRVAQGLALSPVPLNLSGKDRNLVGLGSYLINASGDCNGCHSSGTPPLFVYPYLPNRNPYFGQPAQLDPSVYLNGGTNFGAVGTPTGPLMYAGPDIISRNLTPNYAGLPEGGRTLSQFIQIMRTGIDLDAIHPNCTEAQLKIINNPPAGATIADLPVCIPTGVIPGTMYDNKPVGSFLQVMPWPTFSHLTDRDLEAIYEYLSAIPCIDNTTSAPPAGAPDELMNDCGTSSGTRAISAVKDASVPKGALRLRR